MNTKFVLASCLVWLICAVAGCGRPEEDRSAAFAAPPVVTPPFDIFANGIVLRLEIEIPRSGVSLLRRTRSGPSENRPEVRATVREGDVVYKNVAVHLKGAAGSFRPIDDRPGMTLNFDKLSPGQSFHGLHKISLNNSVQDASYLSEKISRELFEGAGVPVPRAGHALVSLNGRDLGLYVVLEGANRQFLKRYFKNTKGNLFDGGFCGDINESLAVNCGDNPQDRSGLAALLHGLRQTRASGNLAPLENVLDVDRFISMIALEVMIGHWDGYTMNRNNWRIFHDLDSNRMVFIPHGVDQTFGVGGGGRMQASIVPHSSARVAAAVLGTHEGLKRYKERFSQLYTNVFKVDEILARIDEVQAGLQPVLAQWDSSAAAGQTRAAAEFKQRIKRRHAQLRAQANPPAPVKFGSDGVLRLNEWTASQVRAGEPALSQTRDAQGRQILRIDIGKNPSTGSWRRRLMLPPGQYRFHGRVKVNGVAVPDNDMRSGAGLRISKGVMPQKWAGTADWREFVYEFELDETAGDVELICELKALRGSAEFDQTSLRLVRLR